VIGASQTGKGLYCKARLRVPHSGVTLIWSPLEKTNDFAGFIGGRVVSTIWGLAGALKAGELKLVYVPGPDKISDQFDYFCRIVAELHSVRVVIDELSRVTSPSWAPYHWKNLSTAGAHAHLELIGTAQQQSMIDKAFLSNCSEIRCFTQQWEPDAKRLSTLLQVPAQELMFLPKFHYRHWTREPRATVAGIQEIIS
jgi:hypothetical protein